jgi:hypothetical protein
VDQVALAMALVGSFAVLGETGASANAAVTLYVNSSDSGSSCLDNSANACRTLQDAINVGEALTTTDVTIDVAAGTYNESDTINTLPSSDSLTIQGASAVSTTVTGTIERSSVYHWRRRTRHDQRPHHKWHGDGCRLHH